MGPKGGISIFVDNGPLINAALVVGVVSLLLSKLSLAMLWNASQKGLSNDYLLVTSKINVIVFFLFRETTLGTNKYKGGKRKNDVYGVKTRACKSKRIK